MFVPQIQIASNACHHSLLDWWCDNECEASRTINGTFSVVLISKSKKPPADPRLASSNEAKSQRWRHRNEGKSGVSALWVAILNVRIELWILNCQCLEGIQYNQTCWCLNKCSTLYKYTYLHTYTPWYNFLLLYMLVLCILCMLVNVYIRILEDIVWFVWYVYKSTPSVRFVRLYV